MNKLSENLKMKQQILIFLKNLFGNKEEVRKPFAIIKFHKQKNWRRMEEQ